MREDCGCSRSGHPHAQLYTLTVLGVQINNHGRPLDEYYFWPDVLDGLKEMFTRTQFSADQGGYFPAIKAGSALLHLSRVEMNAWTLTAGAALPSGQAS